MHGHPAIKFGRPKHHNVTQAEFLVYEGVDNNDDNSGGRRLGMIGKGKVLALPLALLSRMWALKLAMGVSKAMEMVYEASIVVNLLSNLAGSC